MRISEELKLSLKRELALCSQAVAFYKKAVKDFERKYRLTTGVFIRKFEEGKLGDNEDYFDWYAFSRLLHKWQDTLTALRSYSN